MATEREVLLRLNVRPDTGPAQAALSALAQQLRAVESRRPQGGPIALPEGFDPKKTAAGLDAGLDAQKARLVQLDQAADPKRLRETVAITLELEAAQKHLAEATAAERREQTGLTAAQEQLNARLEATRKAAEALREATRPENIKAQAAATRELEEAQKEYGRALAREQGGGLGEAGQLFKEFGFGRIGGLLQLIGKFTKGKGGGDAAAPDEETRPAGGLADVATPNARPGPAPGLVRFRDAARGKAPADPNAGGKAPLDLLGKGGAETPGADVTATAAEGAEGGAGGLGGLAAALGPAAVAVAGLAIAAGLADAAWRKTEQLVQLASPATVERLNLAFDDLGAVVGQRLQPLVAVAADGVRADVITNVLPSASDVRDTLASLRPAIDDVKAALLDVAPVIKEALKFDLKLAGGFVREFASVVGAAARAFRALGLLPKNDAAGNSFGASAQATSYKTDLSEIGREVRQAAFREGVDRGRDPQEEAVSWLQRISDDIQKVVAWLPNKETLFGKFGGQVLTDVGQGTPWGDAIMHAIRGGIRGH